MTAYGYGEHQENGQVYYCEIRTLNSRFLDTSIKLPRSLIALETEVLGVVKDHLQRGKVDLFFSIPSLETKKNLPTLNPEAARHYLDLFREIRTVLQKAAPNEIFTLNQYLVSSVSEFFKLEGVLQFAETSSSSPQDELNTHKNGLLTALAKAIEQVKIARRTEGTNLEKALLSVLEEIEREHGAIISKAPAIREQIYSSYVKRLELFIRHMNEKEIKAPQGLPEDRLLTEIAVLSEKSDIEEELTRLSSHIAEFKSQISGGDAVGRKLDFLCQEMHREINTLSNKLVQIEISQHTLSLKQSVERLRQQIQNIE